MKKTREGLHTLDGLACNLWLGLSQFPAKPFLWAAGMHERELMLRAVELANKGRGKTAPNPCVGALLVKQGEVIGQGWHEGPGRPHAELCAIENARSAGLDTTGASLWVTLEPCNHWGRTPPCTKAILEAGIASVYVGTLDPNPGIEGGGCQFLRDSGVSVQTGIEEQACRDVIRDFLCWALQKRSFVRLKLAATLDGKIGGRDGASGWVSGQEARTEVHRLRSFSQAVLVGGNTFYRDNPRLDVRFPHCPSESQPLAVVLTSRLPRSDEDYFLLQNRAGQTIFWTSEETAHTQEADRLRAGGIRVWGLPERPGKGLDLESALRWMYAEFGCFDLLCEGGGSLAYSLCEQGLADEIVYFLAPRILGDPLGCSAFNGAEERSMQQALAYRILEQEKVGRDLRVTFLPSAEGATEP